MDMVFNAHSHLWNRFETDSGMNILETSNNGNTYEAFLDTKSRTSAWPSVFNEGNDRAALAEHWDLSNYVLQGDPYGLDPIFPSVAALPNYEPTWRATPSPSFPSLTPPPAGEQLLL